MVGGGGHGLERQRKVLVWAEWLGFCEEMKTTSEVKRRGQYYTSKLAIKTI